MPPEGTERLSAWGATCGGGDEISTALALAVGAAVRADDTARFGDAVAGRSGCEGTGVLAEAGTVSTRSAAGIAFGRGEDDGRLAVLSSGREFGTVG